VPLPRPLLATLLPLRPGFNASSGHV
jgi:hypothetical protein